MTDTKSRMKKIPSIKLGGIRYKLKYSKNPINPEEPDKSLDGLINFSDSTIIINSRLSGQCELQTILHELVHAFFVSIGIRDFDESLIDGLAYQLIGAIRDNPELFRKIIKLGK